MIVGLCGTKLPRIMEKLLEVIKGRLIAGEDVMVSGFGKWSVKDKRARRGRNPQTGDQLVLDARRVVTWHYSPVLREGESMDRRSKWRSKDRGIEFIQGGFLMDAPSMLASSVQIKNLSLPNRITMDPLYLGYAGRDGDRE